MMFATCAKVGCYNKIGYDPDSGKPRPRYCCIHQVELKASGRESDILTLPTSVRNNPSIPTVPPKMVVLVCPICKTRKTSPANLHGYIEPCETEGCSGRMIYHKDVK